MVVGTTSHAGKSLLTAVICRMLARQGYHVTPFKGQNMALNAYVTKSGDEIGHAQAVQAWAAGVEPQVEMNPILLKPQGDMTSQVILNGKVVGQVNAANYYQDYFDRGWSAIVASLETLKQQFDWIVCEGAGSPAEINLKHRDMTNMRVAKYLNAPTLLVADIDRGGVFAHIVGTLQLLDPDERDLIKGVVINKFRGHLSLLQSGIDWLENYTNIPVIGVIPYLTQAFCAEDSLSLFERHNSNAMADLTIAVLQLPRIANFTDFEPLEAEPTINLQYIQLGQRLGTPDAVIIPGSKTTLSDLARLHESGMSQQLKQYGENGGMVVGICGGLQMLGEWVFDPDRLEGEQTRLEGLGLLPLETHITSEKITQRRSVEAIALPYPWQNLSASPPIIEGFEIHQGLTQVTNQKGIHPLWSDPELGWVSTHSRIMGTYLHGLFNNGAWRRSWLNLLRAEKGLPPLETNISNYEQQREQLFDEITDAIAPHLDLSLLLSQASDHTLR